MNWSAIWAGSPPPDMRVVVVQILDPNELTFRFDRAMLFQDVESGKDFYLDPEAVRSEYQRRLQAHTDGVVTICRKLGFAFHRVVTDQPLELALFDFLKSRSSRSKASQSPHPTILPSGVSMNFLAPWFLLGALAVAGPIVFHLIRRVIRERMPFSSLMFLSPTPPKVTRRRKLENLWLLLLRCLCLLLLAIGFARPFLPRTTRCLLQQAKIARSFCSWTRARASKREGLWDKARAVAETYLAQAKPGDQVAIMTFDRQPHTLVSFTEWSAWSVDQRAALARQRLVCDIAELDGHATQTRLDERGRAIRGRSRNRKARRASRSGFDFRFAGGREARRFTGARMADGHQSHH